MVIMIINSWVSYVLKNKSNRYVKQNGGKARTAARREAAEQKPSCQSSSNKENVPPDSPAVASRSLDLFTSHFLTCV